MVSHIPSVPRVRLEPFSETIPGAVGQGWDIYGFVEKNKEWIADGNPQSETVRRYRTLLRAMKNVRYLAQLEKDAYHPFVVREENGAVAGLATLHTGRAIQHPDISRLTTGTDIDYTLTETASDETHLATVRALLHATGSIALDGAVRRAGESKAVVMNLTGGRLDEAPAFAVVPVQHVENRLRGFELACDAGEMVRVEGPASLTVPEAYAHPQIDFAKGGQLAQLYYSG